MVVLHVKQGDQSLFLYETTVNAETSSLVSELVRIQNGRLKIDRLCFEIEELAKHGVCLPPAMHGLTPDQVIDLKLCDDWSKNHLVDDDYVNKPDPYGRRNGKAPVQKLADVLTKTTAEAKAKVSKKLVEANMCITYTDVQDALDMLKGAVMIAYPMGLPSYDTVQQELENTEDLTATQAGKEVLDETATDLWWAGKQLKLDKKLCDYIGKNEKSKLVVKLQKKGLGAPSQEPVLTEQQRKELMLAEYRRREELKKLDEADDDSYLNSRWADNKGLQKTFQGLTNIRFSYR